MILVFPSSNFLTDRSKAVLLYFCSSLTYCLVCLAALWPPVGKVAKAVVAGPMSSAVSLFLLLAYFSLSVPLTRQYTETLQTLRMSILNF